MRNRRNARIRAEAVSALPETRYNVRGDDMRNSTQLENTDWQQTEEGWQTEFACPVVYLGDLSWIACDCSEPTEFS